MINLNKSLNFFELAFFRKQKWKHDWPRDLKWQWEWFTLKRLKMLNKKHSMFVRLQGSKVIGTALSNLPVKKIFKVNYNSRIALIDGNFFFDIWRINVILLTDAKRWHEGDCCNFIRKFLVSTLTYPMKQFFPFQNNFTMCK